MESIKKLEAAWWWARNARLEAIRQKREEYTDPRDPFRALPGREAEYEAASELSQAMDTILTALEHEVARERLTAVKRKALDAMELVTIAGLASLATLGLAAAYVTVQAPDPLTQSAAIVGVGLSLAWAVKLTRKPRKRF